VLPLHRKSPIYPWKRRLSCLLSQTGSCKEQKKNLYPCRKLKPVSPFRPTSSLVPIPPQLSWLTRVTKSLITSVPILQLSDVQDLSENKLKGHTSILVLVIFNPNNSNLDVALLLTDWFPHQNLSNYPTVRRIFLFPLRYQPSWHKHFDLAIVFKVRSPKYFFRSRKGRKALGTRSGLFAESSKILN
jgi:hypothetical protein